MTKPDFEKMADDAVGDWVRDNDRWRDLIEAVSIALFNAYASGRADERERCCAVATDRFVDSPGHEGDEWRFAAEEIIEAIRRGGEE